MLKYSGVICFVMFVILQLAPLSLLLLAVADLLAALWTGLALRSRPVVHHAQV